MNPILAVGAAVTPLMVVLSVTVGASAVTSSTTPAAAIATCVAPATPGTPNGVDGTLDAAEIGNAQIIYSVSAQLGLPQHATVIALATAMQESRLYNLTKPVDHDSLGLFQQRSSMGWGTPAQLVDPVYASKAFYNRLVQVPDWQNLPLPVAAQAVQKSMFPDAYAKWEPLATQLAATFALTTGSCLLDNVHGLPPDIIGKLPPGFALPPTTPPQVVVAITWALSQLGTPYSFGGSCTDPHSGEPAKQCDCSSLMQQAYHNAGVSIPRVTFDQIHVGTPIYDTKQLRPGDLLFVSGGEHVGMYLGQGFVIHAPQTGEVVKISPFAGWWEGGIVGMRRLIV